MTHIKKPKLVLSLKDLTELPCEFNHKSTLEELKKAFKKLKTIFDEIMNEENEKTLVKDKK